MYYNTTATAKYIPFKVSIKLTSAIKNLLSHTTHRPYKIPEGAWQYYQEWNRALFIHWIVSYEELRKHVPQALQLDTFNGQCYISLVAFNMGHIRPKHLPSVGVISNFSEINIRTYVTNNNKSGVYFLNIEAGKLLSCLLAKRISGLPYEKANISRKNNSYNSQNSKKGFHLALDFKIGSLITHKTKRDKWLTERYCLYLQNNNSLYRYDIHHLPWQLNHLTLTKSKTHYNFGAIDLNAIPLTDTHYSEGVKVIAWKRKNCNYQNNV